MSKDNVEIVRLLTDAFKSGDARWLDYYAEDAEVLADVAGGRFTGRREIEGLAEERRRLLGDWRLHRDLLLDAGDRVVALFHRRFVDHDGRKVNEAVAGVYTLRGGKVTHAQAFPTWEGALSAVRADG